MGRLVAEVEEGREGEGPPVSPECFHIYTWVQHIRGPKLEKYRENVSRVFDPRFPRGVVTQVGWRGRSGYWGGWWMGVVGRSRGVAGQGTSCRWTSRRR